MKVVPLISTISAIVICASSLFSCSPAEERQNVSDVEMEEKVVAREVIFSVPSVTCAACLASIRKAVISEPGVISMGGDPKAKTVVLRLSASAPEDDAHLIDAIERAGFEATVK